MHKPMRIISQNNLWLAYINELLVMADMVYSDHRVYVP